MAYTHMIPMVCSAAAPPQGGAATCVHNDLVDVPHVPTVRRQGTAYRPAVDAPACKGCGADLRYPDEVQVA